MIFTIAVVVLLLGVISSTIMFSILSSGRAYAYNRKGNLYFVKLNHILPKIIQWHGRSITILNTIYTSENILYPLDHAHEYAHILQWKKYGKWKMIKFLLKGNFNDPIETEAERIENGYKDQFEEVKP